MRCHNTEAADKWAAEQDDLEAMQGRRTERLYGMIEDKHQYILEYLSDFFVNAFSDENAEEKHAALERIFIRAYLKDPLDNDCQTIVSIERLDDLMGRELDD